MKKRFLSKKTAVVATLAVALAFGHCAHSQPTLIPPSAIPSVYPGGNGLPTTSSFAFGNLLFGSSTYNPYISAWGDRVVWRLANPGSATSFGPQGQVTIAGASETKVAMINAGVPYICAVYRLGSSFYMRLYQWNSGTFIAGPTTLLTNTPGSTAGSRVSIDVYGVGRIGIVWDEIQPVTFQPVLKCKFSTGIGLAFSGNYTLAGTTGQTNPDIAMTRTGSPSPAYLNGNSVHAHIAALSGPPGARVITEYGIPVEDIILTSTSVPFIPSVEDVNNLGYLELNPIPFIDCPDFDYNNYNNWAYTYVRDGDIAGRFSDFAAGIATAVLTDGSMGNVPYTLSGGLYYANYEPTITYSNSASTVFIGWRHSLYPSLQNEAICAEVSRDGSTMVSPFDYLYINSSQTSSAPVFSKHTLTANFLYANTLEYPTLNPTPNVMTHYFHNWANTNFKPALGVDNPVLSADKIGIYPNPVADHFKVTIPAAMAQQRLNFTITDVSGKVIFSSSCKGEQLEDELSKVFVGKAAGTYLLNIAHKNTGYQQEEKLVKIQ